MFAARYRSMFTSSWKWKVQSRNSMNDPGLCIQWCIAKTGGGYTQTGVAKGLKVPCLFIITEVSIRCQKKPRRLVYAVYPQYTTVCIHTNTSSNSRSQILLQDNLLHHSWHHCNTNYIVCLQIQPNQFPGYPGYIFLNSRRFFKWTNTISVILFTRGRPIFEF